ncbi:MAG: hypothetical protein M1549_04170 [Candidatus Dependentiae bacterium]|nr:hypothetical protein [Candidatus Dependentiae bacterium]
MIALLRPSYLLLPAILSVAGLHAVEPCLDFQVPKPFEKYLDDAQSEDEDVFLWKLRTDFCQDDVEPLITLLAKIPYGRKGEELPSRIMQMLHYWARSGSSGVVVKRLDQIASCIEQLKDPEAHEMFSYWHKKCIELWYANETSVLTKLNLPVPEEWKKYFQDNACGWRVHNGNVTQLPALIKALCLSLAGDHTVRERYSAIAKGMEALCAHANSLRPLSSLDEDIDKAYASIDDWYVAIDQIIAKLEDGDNKKELLYWFHRALSHISICDKAEAASRWLKIHIKYGSYTRIRNDKGKSLLHCGLDDELYKTILSRGFTPFDEMFEEGEDPISSGININLLTNVSFHSKRAREIGKRAMLRAIRGRRLDVIRALMLNGINVNQKHICCLRLPWDVPTI